jgi:hypothetical protein
MRGSSGRSLLSLVDFLSLTAICGIALAIVLPQHRVRGLLGNEDRAIAALEELERHEEDHRAKALTDADSDGHGEYASLPAVLAGGAPKFERVEGTELLRRDGYYFAALLPDREKKPVPATSGTVWTDYAEVAEFLVAWPAQPGVTGMRAYARWPGGQLLQHAIDGYPYSRDPPAPDAPIIAIAGGVARPADRYDRDDWRPPVFGGAKRPGR